MSIEEFLKKHRGIDTTSRDRTTFGSGGNGDSREQKTITRVDLFRLRRKLK